MSATEGLLIAAIIVLAIVIIWRSCQRGSSSSRTWDCIDRGSGNVTTVKMNYNGHRMGCKCTKCMSAEARATNENAEYFTQCVDTSMDQKQINCMCEDNDSNLAYAVNDFGAPGLDFKDWVTSQAVDPQVIKNHAEFVTDRINTASTTLTGRTFTPDQEIDSDQIKWQGITGRPQKVPQCSPDQMPDVDYDWYVDKRQLSWTGV